MKYAVLESGGKQYLAREGETIEVDRLSEEVGRSVDFKDVLLLVDDGEAQIGKPYLDKVKVKGTIIAQIKAQKIVVYKYIPKQRYRRKQGHRQRYTRIRIDDIATPSPRKTAEKAEKAEKTSASEKSSKKRAAKASSKKKGSTGAKEKKGSAKTKGSAGSKSKKSGAKSGASSKKSS
jgi:large subunit ribosomal protein L21